MPAVQEPGTILFSLALLVAIGPALALDDVFREYVLPIVTADVLPRLLLGPYFQVPAQRRGLDFNTNMAHRIAQAGGFSDLEDSIFTVRPNTLTVIARVSNLRDLRINYAATVFSCYSLTDPENPANWSALPRPAIIEPYPVSEGNATAFRAWPGTAELRNRDMQASQPDLSWCLSAPDAAYNGTRALGIQRNFSARGFGEPNAQGLDLLLDNVRRKIENPQAAVDEMRASFTSALKRRWRQTRRAVQLRIRSVAFPEPYSDAVPWIASMSAEQLANKTNDIGRLTRTQLEQVYAVMLRSYDIVERSVIFNSNPPIPEVAAADSVAVAVVSVVAGTVVETLVLEKMLENRSFLVHGGDNITNVKLAIHTSALLFIIVLDMLPLVFLIYQEKVREDWLAPFVRSQLFMSSTRGGFVKGEPVWPFGYTIAMSLEIWYADAPRTRKPAFIVTLVLSILLHVSVFFWTFGWYRRFRRTVGRHFRDKAI